MVNVPEQIKKALFERGWTQKKLCAEIDVSENGFKNMLTNNSWKLETIEKIAQVLGKSVIYFLEDSEEKLDSRSKSSERQIFGEQVIEELKAMFEEELRIKNQQIAGLQRTVDVLVGKSEGVVFEPLSASQSEFNELLNSYRIATGLDGLFNTKPTKKSGSKVGGTQFSHVENVLANK